MDPHGDSELLRRYAIEHDELAFAEVVRRHLDGVYAAALRRLSGDTQLAQDVAQLVFIALARQAHKVSNHPVVSAWLYLTTRNQAANVVRAEQRRKAREEEARAMDPNLPDPTHDLEWSRVAPILDGIIDELHENDRRAVLLRFVDRRSFAEIATAFRIKEDAARRRVDRALERMRGRLARRGIASTASALSAALTHQLVVAAPSGLASSIAGAAVAAAPLAGSVASFFQLMTATKTMIGVAGVLIAISATVVTRETLRWHEAQDALAEATRENGQLSAEICAVQDRATAIESRIRDLQVVAADLATAKKAAATPPPTASRLPAAAASSVEASRAAGRAFVARHPEVRAAALAYHHGMMREMFGAFYRQRAFTNEQIEQFENCMMATAGVFRMTTDRDGQLIPISTPTFGDREQRAEEEKQLAALLGRDGVQALRSYMQQSVGRKFTGQLAGALSFTAAPLTTDQTDKLVAIVSEIGATSPKPTTGRYNWDAIVSRSQDVLTEPQRQVLEALQARDEFDAALVRGMQRNAPPVAGTNAGPRN